MLAQGIGHFKRVEAEVVWIIPLARGGEEGWRLMIFCARATRGRGLPSLGLMARPGKSIAKQSEGRAGEKYLPVGGRVRKLRAVEDQSAPIPEEIKSELGGII
jgi:hypothetical protein